MNTQELLKKITEKKEFSKLPDKDVEMTFRKFDKLHYLDEEKIKKTRDLLRKVFSGFTSQKILKIKDKEPEWILRKHLSTRERLPYYEQIYKRIFKKLEKKISIIDLGAGINGFSYKFIKNVLIKNHYSAFLNAQKSQKSRQGFLGFKKISQDINYTAVEAIGQLVELSNHYFKKNKLKAKAVHLSLFELEKIKEIINQTHKPRIVFLLKTIDSLEMLERDYSKKLLLEIIGLVDRIVVSFSTESMLKREKFMVNRKWIVNFIKDNFNILDDFEIAGEKYLVFEKKIS